MAFAVYRLEEIACAIQDSLVEQRVAARRRQRLASPLRGYSYFRWKAFRLLVHYVDNDLQAAFGWLLAMRDVAPMRRRGRVRQNEFHLGLLAMTAAAGTFLSRNKLRDLAVAMERAHALGINAEDFNNHLKAEKRQAEAA